MPTNIYRYLFILSAVLLTTCVEPYFIEESAISEVFVVEGMITNDIGPYTVKLSKTSSTQEFFYKPFSDATVKIIDDTGFEEQLTMIEPGAFMTDTFGIKGVIGRKYKIRIETNDGKIYESKFSELKEPIPINDLHCNYEIRYDPILGIEYEGYRFYSKFTPFKDKESHLIWLPKETYEYVAPFSIDYMYIGYITEYESPDTFKTCWRTRNVRDIFTFSNDPKNNTEAISMSLNHSKLNKFSIKYSLLLNQLSVDEETLQYWKAINDLNSGQSSFYNMQPYQVKGNIENINDPEETVLGYFFAGGITSERIFQTHPGIPGYPCEPDFRGIRYLPWSHPSIWPVWIVDLSGALAIADDYCFDCRLLGGSIVKPDFWE